MKYTAALIMCGCLLFLTGINFVVYGNHTTGWSKILKTNGNNTPDERPVEEKSSNGNINIQEEYVHEFRLMSVLEQTTNSKAYHIHGDAALAIVHYELISPPPDL